MKNTAVRSCKPLLIAAIVLVLAYVAATTIIREIAQPQLFHPTRDDAAHEALLTRSSMEYVVIPTDRETLSGFIFSTVEGPAPLVLYFGGNRDNAAHVLQDLSNTRRTTFTGYRLAMIDYPGYGLSEGSPSDASFRRMALAAYDALAAREDVTEIVVMGYSIGTGPANYVAANREVSGLILMAPYASGADLFNNVVDVFHGPLKALISYKMPSEDFAKKIAVQPLIFATEKDELVPYASSVRLSEAYPAGCQLVTVPYIDHSGFWDSYIVLKRIPEYLAEVTGDE